jgi:hypothetical protein
MVPFPRITEMPKKDIDYIEFLTGASNVIMVRGFNLGLKLKHVQRLRTFSVIVNDLPG